MTNPPLQRRLRAPGRRAGRPPGLLPGPALALALAALLLSGLRAAPLFAQEGEAESAITDDFDSLFDEPVIEEGPESPESGSEGGAEGAGTAAAPEEAFLLSEKLEWGGSFSATPSIDWMWYGNWHGLPDSWDALVRPDVRLLNAAVEGQLFFDARPERDFRVFGKIKSSFGYDSSTLETTPAGEPWRWELRLFELFSDFQLGERVFFRVGKHTIRWGVGYFFSPADVFSLASIDPEDPEAEREGPVSLKTQVPFGPHNLYLYVIAAPDVTAPEGLAYAPKLELVIGGYELGLGAYYRPDLAVRPKGLVTLTGSVWDIDLFGEAVLQWGSDRTYVRPGALPLTYETYRREDELLFSATAGAAYLNADWNLALYAQYYYNGTGYSEFSPADLAAAGLALTVEALAASDLLYRGQHYLAGSLSWSEILDSDFNLGVLYLGNFSDGSGLVSPTVSWQPWDYFRLSFGIPWRYGEAGDELAPSGEAFGISLSATLGSGRF